MILRAQRNPSKIMFDKQQIFIFSGEYRALILCRWFFPSGYSGSYTCGISLRSEARYDGTQLDAIETYLCDEIFYSIVLQVGECVPVKTHTYTYTCLQRQVSTGFVPTRLTLDGRLDGWMLHYRFIARAKDPLLRRVPATRFLLMGHSSREAQGNEVHAVGV